MRNVIAALQAAFRPVRVAEQKAIAESQRLGRRKIVMKKAFGNVRIQRGMYLTEHDVQQRYERIARLSL